MTFSSKAHTIEMALAELAALPYANAQPGEGFFRGSSFADGHPMVMTWVNDPLDGWQRVWYHVEIQPPRAFNSCSVCDRDFPGPRGATDYIEHICTSVLGSTEQQTLRAPHTLSEANYTREAIKQ